MAERFGIDRAKCVKPSGTLAASLLINWNYPPLNDTEVENYSTTLDLFNYCIRKALIKLGLAKGAETIASASMGILMTERYYERVKVPPRIKGQPSPPTATDEARKSEQPYDHYDENLLQLNATFKDFLVRNCTA